MKYLDLNEKSSFSKESINRFLIEVRKEKTLSESEIREHLRLGEKEKVFNCNLRLVVAVAAKYSWAMPIEDLIQEGCIGLLQAIEEFKLNCDNKFCTFAIIIVRRYMLDAMKKNTSADTSLDEPISDGEGNTITRGDFLVGDMDVDDNLDTTVILAERLDRLTKRERTIVVLYYGIGSDIPMGYSAIGMKLGISDERARQLHLAALAKMRG